MNYPPVMAAGLSKAFVRQLLFAAVMLPGGAPVDGVEEARALESRTRKVIEQSLGAVVGLDVVVNDHQHATGSGVIIADQWILTAGHVCDEPGRDVVVRFADGGRAAGKTAGLRWEGQEDCGLVHFDGAPAGTPIAPIGQSASLKQGDWVVGMGHTYGLFSEPWRPPVARIGRIRGHRGNTLDIDVPISSGDSGGPVFDLDGRVIGTLSSGGDEPWIGAATAVDLASRLMDAMKSGEQSGTNAQEADGATRVIAVQHAPASHDGADGRDSPEMLSGLASLGDGVMNSTVGVMVAGRDVGLGLAVERGFIVCKASDVGLTESDLAVTLPDGLTLGALRIATDDQLDLMLLWAGPDTGLDPVSWSIAGVPPTGSLVASPGRMLEPMAIGIVGLPVLPTGRQDVLAPYLGVNLALPAAGGEGPPTADGVRLERVAPGDAAARAGLRDGDVVLAIGGVATMSNPDFSRALRLHGSGDVVKFKVRRGEEHLELPVRLGERELSDAPASSTALVPASHRVSGFGEVIQHDSILSASEIGGALVDLAGNVVGMNIARVDRTKTYALPGAVVAAAVSRLAQSADPAEPLVLVSPFDNAIVIAEKDGLIELLAESAEVSGPSARYMRNEPPKEEPPVDEPGFVAGLRGRDDLVRWAIEPLGAGVFMISVEQACAEESYGSTYTIRLGEREVTAQTAASATPSSFRTVEVQTIEVPEGRSFLELSPMRLKGTATDKPGPQGEVVDNGLMRLRAVRLRRVG